MRYLFKKIKLTLKIFLVPQEAKFDEESEARINCPVFVVPGSTVTWFKQGEDMPTNSHTKGGKLMY